MAQTKEFYEFGGFRLDLKNRLLSRDGQPLALTVKEFELMLFLVANAGRVIEKNDLLDEIWKDTFVAEGTLTQSISRLRRKLETGDSNADKIIETLPKRGYRFLPAVTIIESPLALVVEEHTLTRIHVEETISLSEPPAAASDSDLKGELPIIRLQPPAAAFGSNRRNRLLWAVVGVLAAAIAFAVYQDFFRQIEPKTILAAKIAPFSGLPGVESFPAFSPDGKQVAFAWNGGAGDILDIYVKLVGEGEPVRLTKGATSAYYPIFSPDGKRVAIFRSTPETSTIYSVSALGGAERKIADVQSGGTSFSFAPDGRAIAVADRETENSARAIFLIDIETGAKRKLTQPSENASDETPRFAPDGKTVAFLRAASSNDKDIYIAPATDGAAARRLTFDNAFIQGAAWSADGAAIVFASRRKNATARSLWQIASAGGEPSPILVGAKSPANPAIAPDGKTVAFTEDSENANVWRYEIGAVKTSNSAPALIAYLRENVSPQLAPDGARVAFVSNRTGKDELWLSDAEGRNQRQLTASTNSPGSPRWSPDGRFIVYDALENEKSDVYLVAVEGGAPRRLTDDAAQNLLPSWSADGRWIYFASNRTGEYQIWRMTAAGGAQIQITRHGGFESIATPDDREIFYRKEDGENGIWRVPSEGGAETFVPELSEIGFRRSWTITNKGVYFIARSATSGYKIKSWDFTAKPITEIAAPDKAAAEVFPVLSATADGKTILYAQYDQNASSIMLAEIGK